MQWVTLWSRRINSSCFRRGLAHQLVTSDTLWFYFFGLRMRRPVSGLRNLSKHSCLSHKLSWTTFMLYVGVGAAEFCSEEHPGKSACRLCLAVPKIFIFPGWGGGLPPLKAQSLTHVAMWSQRSRKHAYSGLFRTGHEKTKRYVFFSH